MSLRLRSVCVGGCHSDARFLPTVQLQHRAYRAPGIRAHILHSWENLDSHMAPHIHVFNFICIFTFYCSVAFWQLIINYYDDDDDDDDGTVAIVTVAAGRALDFQQLWASGGQTHQTNSMKFGWSNHICCRSYCYFMIFPVWLENS